MRHLLPALVLALPAAAAAQDCPATRAQAQAGLQFAIDDGSSLFIRRGADGVVTEEWSYPDGFRLRVTAVHGVHTLEIGEIAADGALVPGSVEVMSYAAPLPAEPPGVREWSTAGSERLAGNDPVEVAYTSTVTALGELAIGPCRYKAVSVANRIAGPDWSRIEEVDFLPALGVAILRSLAGGEEEPTLTTPTAITLAGP